MLNPSHEPHLGKVYLVGAGPGDPGLITLRAIQCLQRADLILCDYLVNPAILRHANASTEVIALGHHSRGREMTQEEINQRMVQAALKGKVVVRLKGGDPDIFGRSAEEMEVLAQAGIPFETVPGVTAALAAAGYAGIPITHAEYASAVALITGQEREAKPVPALDFEALARFPGTLVFYMGVHTAEHWSQRLIEQGKSPQTPVAIVRRCSWNDQAIVRTTLGELTEVIVQQEIRPPAIIVVGKVVDLAPEVPWFMARPLWGIRVLVTRPRAQAAELADRLGELGAEVRLQPAIELLPPDDWSPVDAALARLDQYDWVVFSSANGVTFLLDRLLATGRDYRALGGVRLAAMGPGTADELGRRGLKADMVPERFCAESLAATLAGLGPDQRFLLARASRGREVLAQQLVAGGGHVEQVVAYQSRDVEEPDPAVAAALAAGRIDWITVTSSAIAQSLVRLFGESLRLAKLASISPITSETLESEGFRPTVEAEQYTTEGVVQAILRAQA